MGWNSWRFGLYWFGLCCRMNFSVAFQYQFWSCRSPSLLYWASAPWKVLLERTILWRAWWFQTFFIFQPCSTWVTSSIWQKTRYNSLSWLADSFCCMINPILSSQITVLLQRLIIIHNNNLSLTAISGTTLLGFICPKRVEFSQNMFYMPQLWVPRDCTCIRIGILWTWCPSAE